MRNVDLILSLLHSKAILKGAFKMNFIENGSVTSPEGFLSSGIHVGPIYVTKEHLKDNKAQAIIINSGNANTLNGEEGLKNAEKMACLTSDSLNIDKNNVLVASTGVIGVPLNIDLLPSFAEVIPFPISVAALLNLLPFDDNCDNPSANCSDPPDKSFNPACNLLAPVLEVSIACAISFKPPLCP